jgi:hypothetical protein
VDFGGVVRVGIELIAREWVYSCLTRLGSSSGLATNRSRGIGNCCWLGQGLGQTCSESCCEEEFGQHRCEVQRLLLEETVEAMILNKMEVLRPYLRLRIRVSPNPFEEPHQSRYHPGR